VAADREHTLILRKADLSAASVPDRQRFEAVGTGDEQVVIADKTYWSEARSAWLARRGVANCLLRRAKRGAALSASDQMMNRAMSAIRCGIEKVFGYWQRTLGCRRTRHVGWAHNRLELVFKCVIWNLKRWVKVGAA
jgi:IS5 family transposase